MIAPVMTGDRATGRPGARVGMQLYPLGRRPSSRWRSGCWSSRPGQRLTGLAVWAVVFELAGSLESFLLLSNRLYDLGIELPKCVEASNLIIGALGLGLLTGGILARRREQVAA